MFNRGKIGIKLKDFVDSDFAANCDNRKSTFVYVFNLNDI